MSWKEAGAPAPTAVRKPFSIVMGKGVSTISSFLCKFGKPQIINWPLTVDKSLGSVKTSPTGKVPPARKFRFPEFYTNVNFFVFTNIHFCWFLLLQTVGKSQLTIGPL
jgi:hypothetical protein